MILNWLYTWLRWQQELDHTEYFSNFDLARFTGVAPLHLSVRMSFQLQLWMENNAHTWICSFSEPNNNIKLSHQQEHCSHMNLQCLLQKNTTNSCTSSVFKLKFILKAHNEAEINRKHSLDNIWNITSWAKQDIVFYQTTVQMTS